MDSFVGIVSVVFKILLFLFVLFLILEILSFLLWFMFYKFVKKYEFPENISKYKAKSIFYRLLYEFPKQFWLDRFRRKPRRVHGIWCPLNLWGAGEWKDYKCSGSTFE